jgi:hypothetical protein
MPIISRSTGDSQREIQKRFDEYMEKGGENAKKIKERYADIATLLKVTTDTEGWKQVIRPFLENRGNPAKIFGFIRKGLNNQEAAYQAGKTEAYVELLKFVDFLVKTLED